MKLEVFDPPMICSTGADSPVVDPNLVQFAADLEWLSAKGVDVTRANLTQQPDAFAKNEIVFHTMREKGVDKLPFILINGRMAGMGLYPSRNQMAQVLDLSAGLTSKKLLTESDTCSGPSGSCS